MKIPISSLRISRVVSLSTLICVLVVISAGQNSPDWIEVQTANNTLGKMLEEPYSAMLFQCTGLKKLPFVKKETHKPEKGIQRSAIPKLIQVNLRGYLDKPVWFQNRSSLARIMSFAYPTNKIALTAGPPTDENNQIFDGDFTVNPATMLPSGVSYVVYSDNCTRIVSAAVDASAGYTLPILTIKGALKADAQSANRATFLYVRGNFVSPFGRLLSDDQANVNDRLRAYLTLWGWYSSRNVRSTSPMYFIRSFNGIGIFQGVETTRRISGETSASGSLGLPFASIKADADLIAKDEVTIRVNDFSTYAFSLDSTYADVKMDPLPSIDKIRSVIGAYRTNLNKEYRGILERGVTVQHRQWIEGLPDNFCNESSWKRSVAEGLTIESVRFTSPTSKVCEFSLSYTPPEKLFVDSSKDDLILDYRFESTRKVGDDFIEIPAQSVLYQRSNSPTFGSRNYSETFSQQNMGAYEKLEWTVKFDAFDSYGVVRWNQNVRPRNIQIRCDDEPSFGVDAPAISVFPTGDDRDREIRLTFARLFLKDGFDFNKFRQCTVEGSLEFGRDNSLGGPATIERSLPQRLTLFIPQKSEPKPTPDLQPSQNETLTPEPPPSQALSPSPTPTPTPTP